MFVNAVSLLVDGLNGLTKITGGLGLASIPIMAALSKKNKGLIRTAEVSQYDANGKYTGETTTQAMSFWKARQEQAKTKYNRRIAQIENEDAALKKMVANNEAYAKSQQLIESNYVSQLDAAEKLGSEEERRLARDKAIQKYDADSNALKDETIAKNRQIAADSTAYVKSQQDNVNLSRTELDQATERRKQEAALLKQQESGRKGFAKSVGAFGKSLAGNIGMALAMSAAIELASYGWEKADEYFTITKGAKLDAKAKVLDTYNEKIEAIGNNKDTINSLATEFKTLAAGVDANGKNIGLSADEFKRYNEIVEQLIDINPKLVKSYNEQGQAIIDQNTAIEDSIKYQDKLQKRAVNRYTSEKSLGAIIEGVEAEQTDALKEARDAAKEITGSLGHSHHGRYSSNSAMNIEQLRQLVQEREKNISDLSGKKLKEAKENYNDLQAAIDTFDQLVQPIVDNLNTYVQNASDETGRIIASKIPEGMAAGFQAGLKNIAGNEDLDETEKLSAARGLADDVADIYKNNTDGFRSYYNAVKDIQEDWADGTEKNASVVNSVLETSAEKFEELADAAPTEELKAFYQLQANDARDFVKTMDKTVQNAMEDWTGYIDGARSAKEDFDEAMQSGDYYTGVESAKSIYDEIMTSQNTGGFGSQSFWTGAEQILGRAALEKAGYDVDIVKSKLKDISPLLTSSASAARSFEERLYAASEDGKLLNEFGEQIGTVIKNSKGGIEFDIPIENITEAADALGVSEETLTALIDMTRQYDTVDFYNKDDVLDGIKAQAKAGDAALRFGEDNKEAAMSLSELGRETGLAGEKLKELKDYLEEDGRGINILSFTGSAKELKEDFQDLGLLKDGQIKNIDTFTQKMHQMNVGAEELVAGLRKTGLDEGLDKILFQKGYKGRDALEDYINDMYSNLDADTDAKIETNPEVEMAKSSEEIRQMIEDQIDPAPIEVNQEIKIHPIKLADELSDDEKYGLGSSTTDGNGNTVYSKQVTQIVDVVREYKKTGDPSGIVDVIDNLDPKIRVPVMVAIDEQIEGESIFGGLDEIISSGGEVTVSVTPKFESGSSTDIESTDNPWLNGDVNVGQTVNVEGNITKLTVSADVKPIDVKAKATDVDVAKKASDTTVKVKAKATDVDVAKNASDTVVNVKARATDVDVAKNAADKTVNVEGKVTKIQLPKKSVGTVSVKAKAESVKLPDKLDKTATITYKVNDKAVVNFTPPPKKGIVTYSAKMGGGDKAKDQSASVAYEANFSGIGKPPTLSGIVKYHGIFPTKAPTLTGTINYHKNVLYSGTEDRPRLRSIPSMARGSGKIGPKNRGGLTLTGELGPELVWLPDKDESFVTGLHGPEMQVLPANAVVWPNDETKRIFGSSVSPGTLANTRGAHSTNGLRRIKAGSMAGGGGTLISYVTPSGKTGKVSAKSKKQADKSTKDLFDFIEIRIDRLERKIKKFMTKAEGKWRSYTDRIKAYNNAIAKNQTLIATANKAENKYAKKAAKVSLKSSIKKKVRNGSIDLTKYGKKTQEKIKRYQELWEKSLDAQEKALEAQDAIYEAFLSKLELIGEEFDNKLSTFEHSISALNTQIDLLEARGSLGSVNYLDQKKGAIYDSINMQLNYRQDVMDELQARLDDKDNPLIKGSTQWYEYVNKVYEIDEAIGDLQVDLAEIPNLMQQIENAYFDYGRDIINNLIDANEASASLLDGYKMVDDETGKFTEKGIAALGLYNANMELYKQQAAEYAAEMRRIQTKLAADPYNQELIERYNELASAQQDAVQSVKAEQDAIVDLVNEAYQSQLDKMRELIDEYIESIEAAKDLYDYQKRIADEARKVSNIRKQLTAYEGMTTEEAQAKIQKLTVQLRDEERALRDSEYDQYVKDQRELLDDLYDDYEKLINERLDDIDGLLEEGIAAIEANGGKFISTVEEINAEYGLMQTDYQSSLFSTIESTGSAIVAAINANSRASGDADAARDDAENSASGSGGSLNLTDPRSLTPTPEPAETEKASKTETDYKKLYNQLLNRLDKKNNVTASELKKMFTYGEKIGKSKSKVVKEMANVDGSGGLTYKDCAKAAKKLGYKWSTVKSWGNMTKYVSQSDFKKFKQGGLADFTGPAWLDGTKKKPEIVLNPVDSENFLKLKDILANSMPQLEDALSQHNLKPIASPNLNSVSNSNVDFGGVNIQIDHVQDYNDFVTQLKKDDQFEKMIKAMSTDQLAGKSSMAKNKFRWS